MSRTADRDEQLREDFLRLREIDGVVSLEVAIVEWNGPHAPELRWVVAQRFASTPSLDEMRRTQQRVLEDPSFFAQCSMCNERCNIGHMHSRDVCQGCAEAHLGVIH